MGQDFPALTGSGQTGACYFISHRCNQLLTCLLLYTLRWFSIRGPFKGSVMYRISELAKRVGLSRTTLLYYEKTGLLTGKRLANGYRIYSDYDVQRLRLVQQLHAAGLTLSECKACLEAKTDRQVLLNRLAKLDTEIAEKQNARLLLAALLGEEGHKEWNETIDRVAPDAHLEWLIKQGFSETEALRLKWLSKDMNEHDRYMNDFFQIYGPLDRWGPGLDEDSLKALSRIPFPPEKILEIGCGKGVATTVLAEHSGAQITAVDNDSAALERLLERAEEAGVKNKVITVCASMTELPFAKQSFDLIWSETSAYIMGVLNAMKSWRNLLVRDGILVYSDLVWLTDNPSAENSLFWKAGYPEMATVQQREKQAREAGFTVLDSFTLSEAACRAYYDPLQERVNEVKGEMAGSAALRDIEQELAIYSNYGQEFGFQMFILQKE